MSHDRRRAVLEKKKSNVAEIKKTQRRWRKPASSAGGRTAGSEAPVRSRVGRGRRVRLWLGVGVGGGLSGCRRGGRGRGGRGLGLWVPGEGAWGQALAQVPGQT
eukprot:5409833-Prymnesium_polylepis.1